MKIYAYSLLYPASANKTSLTDVIASCIVGGASAVWKKFNLKARYSMNIIHGLPYQSCKNSNQLFKGKGDDTRWIFWGVTGLVS